VTRDSGKRTGRSAAEEMLAQRVQLPGRLPLQHCQIVVDAEIPRRCNHQRCECENQNDLRQHFPFLPAGRRLGLLFPPPPAPASTALRAGSTCRPDLSAYHFPSPERRLPGGEIRERWRLRSQGSRDGRNLGNPLVATPARAARSINRLGRFASPPRWRYRPPLSRWSYCSTASRRRFRSFSSLALKTRGHSSDSHRSVTRLSSARPSASTAQLP
jgi:hypothetical protein